jgi:hypothetical protein
MSEQEQVDLWLRDAMRGDVPRLSAAFDARLEKRLRPRRLTATGRIVMAAYVLAALLVSVWALRGAALDWSLVAVVLLPIAVVASVYSRWINASVR